MTKFQQNPLGGYGYSLFYFLQWESTKIFATLAILYFFFAENPFKTDRKKYNIAKVANILVYSHCKKYN